MTLRVCATAGCASLTTSTRCDKCARDKRRREDRRRPSSRQRGYTAQHERDRRAFLAAHPVCQWHEGCLAPATVLDHIDGNPHNRDPSNYRGYCAHHHGQRTARDQPGGWHRGAAR